MDDLLGAFGESIAHGGPAYALVAAAALLFCVYVWPSLAKRMEKTDDREDRREARKAEESRLREEHDREAARLQGQWLEQQDRSNAAMERSNAVTEGVRAQLDRLNQNLEDSKANSHRMGEAVAEISRGTGELTRKIDAIYERVAGGGERSGDRTD